MHPSVSSHPSSHINTNSFNSIESIEDLVEDFSPLILECHWPVVARDPISIPSAHVSMSNSNPNNPDNPDTPNKLSSHHQHLRGSSPEASRSLSHHSHQTQFHQEEGKTDNDHGISQICLPFLPTNIFASRPQERYHNLNFGHCNCRQSNNNPSSAGRPQVIIGESGLVLVVDCLVYSYERTTEEWHVMESESEVALGGITFCGGFIILLTTVSMCGFMIVCMCLYVYIYI